MRGIEKQIKQRQHEEVEKKYKEDNVDPKD